LNYTHSEMENNDYDENEEKYENGNHVEVVYDNGEG
jgi:hypothetical protein